MHIPCLFCVDRQSLHLGKMLPFIGGSVDIHPHKVHKRRHQTQMMRLRIFRQYAKILVAVPSAPVADGKVFPAGQQHIPRRVEKHGAFERGRGAVFIDHRGKAVVADNEDLSPVLLHKGFHEQVHILIPGVGFFEFKGPPRRQFELVHRIRLDIARGADDGKLLFHRFPKGMELHKLFIDTAELFAKKRLRAFHCAAFQVFADMGNGKAQRAQVADHIHAPYVLEPVVAVAVFPAYRHDEPFFLIIAHGIRADAVKGRQLPNGIAVPVAFFIGSHRLLPLPTKFRRFGNIPFFIA